MKTLAAMALLLFACTQAASKDKDDFPLRLHVTAVEQQSGTNEIRTNSAGKIRGGDTYFRNLYTVTIDGDPVTYKVTMNRADHILNVEDTLLHVGDYPAR